MCINDDLLTGTTKPSTTITHVPYVITDRPLSGKYTSSVRSSDRNIDHLVLTLLVTLAKLWSRMS